MEFNNIVYAILAGVLPALLWLWFWLREDNLHPEPRAILAISFIAGSVSVIAAVLLEGFTKEIINDVTYRYIVWAAIEELVKFAAVALVALRFRYLDEPVDAMIYCITVALGFAALENALFILTPLSTGEIAKSVVTGNLRFIGATLLHVVSTASIGFAMGVTFYRGAFVKTITVIGGIIVAIALHASFNLAILTATVTGTLKVFGWVWCAVVILIILFEEIKGIKDPKSAKTA